MSRLTVQYLEGGRGFVAPTAAEVQAQLRRTFALLPITDLLIGWDVPPELVRVCRAACEQAEVRLYQWHPLLTCWGELSMRPAWLVRGPDGLPLEGFNGLPEFTFLRPDDPAVQEAVLARLARVIRSGFYDGIFLDRIRYPAEWAYAYGRLPEPAPITQLVTRAAEMIRSASMQVGLDCFAPSLASLVGQLLKTLGAVADWIKVMVYGHTWAPAGLPFELQRLGAFIATHPEHAAYFKAHLPNACSALGKLDATAGLPPEALRAEIRLGREIGLSELLAGIELVQVAGVTRLSPAQVRADLEALCTEGADGVSLSWELRLMPEELILATRKFYTKS